MTMTPDELRALADCLDDPNAMQRTARRKAADYLRAQADAQPVAWLVTGGIAFHDESYSSREAAEAALIKRDDHARIKPLYTHPAPAAPQAERQPVREPCFCDTAYPDSDPNATCGDCPRDYLPAASELTEAQIEARDALLDFISENGTASEGVQHYLDRYVRAALAAKEQK